MPRKSPKSAAEERDSMKRRHSAEPTDYLQHAIVGGEGGYKPDAFSKKLREEEGKFVKRGSQRGPGKYTAEQTGAKQLAVRHFEEFVRKVKTASAARRAKRMV